MMVWCTICNHVVWAYDHTRDDVRGLANLMRLPCPNCGTQGSFDGYGTAAAEHFARTNGKTGDIWAGFHIIAETNHLTWSADGYNRWFGEQTAELSVIIQTQYLEGLINAKS